MWLEDEHKLPLERTTTSAIPLEFRGELIPLLQNVRGAQAPTVPEVSTARLMIYYYL